MEFSDPDDRLAYALVRNLSDVHVVSKIFQDPPQDPYQIVDRELDENLGLHEHIDPVKRQLASETLVFASKLVWTDALVPADQGSCFVQKFV